MSLGVMGPKPGATRLWPAWWVEAAGGSPNEVSHRRCPILLGSCARRDFEDLVGADVLVAGESGFPRLASVLSQQTRVDIESPTHHGLGNINDDDLIVVPRLDLFWTLSWVPHFLAEVEALTRTGGAAPATDGLDASTDALVADYKAAMALGAADESLKRSLAESLARKLPARTAEQCLREAP